MVRLVVLNYNGGDEVLECIESLEALDWPIDRREIVVVDNASSDGSPERIAEAHPSVRLIRNRENSGFSANNLAMTDLAGIDFVGLVNPDATVEPGWLQSLVSAMADDAIGAVSPLILLATEVVEVDTSALVGQLLHAAEIDGHEVLPATERLWRLRGDDHGEGPSVIRSTHLELATAGASPNRVRLHTSPAQGRPRWSDAEVLRGPCAVVNNAGIELREHGYGADRGLGDTDLERYAESAEVFGWSGGGVLLRTSYLDDVGLFDPLFFLYYEDFDLSWRGRSRGWRYVFAPGAVMRHHHATSTVEGSSLFVFQTELNRLIAVVTNAPSRFAAVALVRFMVATLGYLRADVVMATLRRRRRSWSMVWHRTRVLARLLRLTPRLLGRRRALARRRTVDPDQILEWVVDGR